MSFLTYGLGANYKGFLINLKEISKNENLNYSKLKIDYLKCLVLYGAGLSDYLNYQLWNKNNSQRAEYVTIKDQYKFYASVSPEEYKTFFTIKFNFLNNFKKYITRDWFVPEQSTFDEFKTFCAKHNQFMVKPYDGLGGYGISKKSICEISDLESFFNELSEKRLFLEEVIIQHPDTAKFSPNSVNTIRIMTLNLNSFAEILYAGFRVGAGSHLDNFHAGGMGVFINKDTGKLEGNAFNKNLDEFEFHPLTNIKFDGYQLPFWQEICDMCIEASFVNTNIHVVGWDVAITENGPTFIEGNRRPGFDLPQITSKQGRKDIIRNVYSKLNIK